MHVSERSWQAEFRVIIESFGVLRGGQEIDLSPVPDSGMIFAPDSEMTFEPGSEIIPALGSRMIIVPDYEAIHTPLSEMSLAPMSEIIFPVGDCGGSALNLTAPHILHT